jgi:arylsulfatase A-like enzyme
LKKRATRLVFLHLGFFFGVFSLTMPTDASGPTLGETAIRLGNPDAGIRFDAIQAVTGSKHPQMVALIERTSELKPLDEAMKTSAVARAAVDFVRLKLAGGTVDPQSAAPERSSVILISIDTLRADHLGCYGYERDVSPNIDGLAEAGVLFADALSTSSWTLPAHMSMLTSLYPSFHKMEKGGRLGSVRLDESETTLAELLQPAGWATAGIVAHPFLSGEWGFDAGFDLYRRYATQAEAQTDRARLWLEWHQFQVNRGLRQPEFFLFLHYLDPHETYSPPPPYATKYFPDYKGPLSPRDKFVTLFSQMPFANDEDFRYALALYDGEIDYTDAQLGRVLAKLAELGRSDSTLIVLTSDHGEEFKDHGSMGHKSSLYREQTRVPLVFSHRKLVASGRKVEAPVSVVDITPTILDLLGRPLLGKAQGVSLAPYLVPGSEEAKPPARHLFTEMGPLGVTWEGHSHLKAVRNERYNLIVNYDREWKQLFDRIDDPLEKKDLYEAKKDTAEIRDLQAQLDGFVRAGLAYNASFREKNQIEIDEETRERLRALGYME